MPWPACSDPSDLNHCCSVMVATNPSIEIPSQKIVAVCIIWIKIFTRNQTKNINTNKKKKHTQFP